MTEAGLSAVRKRARYRTRVISYATIDRAALLAHVDAQAAEIKRLRVALVNAVAPLEALNAAGGTGIQAEIAEAVMAARAALAQEVGDGK